MSTLRPTFGWTLSCRAAALTATAAILLSACTESVAPPPTGQIGGGNGGPAPFGNDIPIASSGPPVISSAGGTSPRPPISHDVPATSDAVAALPDAKGLGKEFYATAAEVGSKGPAGPPVRTDDRGEQAVAKAASQHPAMASFDASAAMALPAPDPKAAYQDIVDPAEGTIEQKDQFELKTPASQVERVLFSAPSAGQVVVASRLSSSGEPDRTCLDRYNLATGAHESRIELADQAALLDVSPDGTRALVRFTFGLPPELKPSSSDKRLDVIELSEVEGRHIVGWSPGAGSGGESSVPVDAAFLDGDRVLTLSDSGRLTLWNLAEQKVCVCRRNWQCGSSGHDARSQILRRFHGNDVRCIRCRIGCLSRSDGSATSYTRRLSQCGVLSRWKADRCGPATSRSVGSVLERGCRPPGVRNRCSAWSRAGSALRFARLPCRWRRAVRRRA